MSRFEVEINGVGVSAGVYEGEGWIDVTLDADCSGAHRITADDASLLAKAFLMAGRVATSPVPEWSPGA